MAKAKKAAAQPAVKLKKGDTLKFKGYSELPDDMEPMFEEGDILIVDKVEEVAEDGQVQVKVYAQGDEDKESIDTIFVPEEAEPHTEKKAVKGKAKAAEQDDEDAEQEDEAPAKRGKAVKEPAKKAKAKKSAKAEKEVEAPARTKEEADMEEITHTAAVRKLIKKGDLVSQAKTLANQAEQTFFHLGGLLAEIHVTKAYMEAGYDAEGGWEEFLNAEMGIEYRKAMYLVDIYRTFSKLEIDEARIAKIGWTKAKLLARQLRNADPEDIDDLLDAAEEMTRDDLEQHIKETVVGGKSSGAKIKKVVYKMTAFADEADYIGQAIQRAQEMVEGGDTNEAMKHIFREWAMAADGVEVPVEDAIKALEDRYGVQLELVEGEAAPAKKAPAKGKAGKVKKAAAKAKPKVKTKPAAKKAAPAKVKAKKTKKK